MNVSHNYKSMYSVYIGTCVAEWSKAPSFNKLVEAVCHGFESAAEHICFHLNVVLSEVPVLVLQFNSFDIFAT